MCALLLAVPTFGGVATAGPPKKAPPPPASLAKDRVDLPKTIVVSLSKQRLTVYQGTRAIASSRISSGKAGHRTPKGVFSIIQKRRRHYSNLYNGAPMPYMQRITWSGVAFHAGHIPGYPASHGCIRLPHSFAKQLFSMTSMNDRVVVTDDPREPRSIVHDGLIKPLPPGNPDDIAKAESGSDAAPSHHTGTVQWLMGVATANAAEVYGDLQAEHRGPLTRASVAAARARHLETLAGKAEEARKWAQEAGDRLKVANNTLAELIKAPRLKQVERASLLRTAGRLDDEKRSIERELREFVISAGAAAETDPAAKPLQTATLDTPRRPRPTRSDATLAPVAPPRLSSATLEQREGEIETRLMAKLAEIDALTADIAALDASIASHDEALSAARTHRDILKERYVTAKSHYVRIMTDHKKAKQAAELYDKPITVLVSRKKGRLYVRQDHEDILEAPVEFTDPDSPVGTHVFTALDYTDDDTDLVWKVITPATGAPDVKRPRGMSRTEWRELQREAADRAGGQTAERALARMKISDAVRTRLAELVKPGSTIMISDNGKSLETGEYTDLIVQY